MKKRLVYSEVPEHSDIIIHEVPPSTMYLRQQLATGTLDNKTPFEVSLPALRPMGIIIELGEGDERRLFMVKLASLVLAASNSADKYAKVRNRWENVKEPETPASLTDIKPKKEE